MLDHALETIHGGARMLETLAPVESDSLLALIAMANADPRPDKIDVGVGVFRDGSGATPIPRSLKEATAWLKESKGAREVLGDAFVDHYVITREWEVRQFERVVTDWELKRYFESI